MDESWFDYSSGWESELDKELEKFDENNELEKFYEHESIQERSDWTDALTNTLTLTVCSIASSMHFICFILILFWCNGVVQFIYATRALILMLNSLTQIVFNRIFTSLESVNMNHDGNPTDVGPPIESFIFSTIIASLFYTEEILTSFFLHELYLCTSRMEVREQQTFRLVIKVIAALILILVSQGLITFFTSDMDPFENSLTVILKLTLTQQPAVCIITSGFVIYFSYHILSSLKKSQHFRENSQAQPDKKNELLSSLVLITMIAQSFKFTVRVIEFVLICIHASRIVRCAELLDVVGECITHIDLHNIDYLHSFVHLSILEFFWILFKTLRK